MNCNVCLRQVKVLERKFILLFNQLSEKRIKGAIEEEQKFYYSYKKQNTMKSWKLITLKSKIIYVIT